MAKNNKKKYAVTGAAVIAIIVAILGLPLVILAYMADFIGELLMCLAVAFGGIGEWLTAKRHLSKVFQAIFGAFIIVGALVLIFAFGKTSLILMMLTQFPFYIALFLAMCGLWIIIKHTHEAVYGVITIILAALVLLIYGIGIGIGIEFYLIIGLVIFGLIVARRKAISFDILHKSASERGRK